MHPNGDFRLRQREKKIAKVVELVHAKPGLTVAQIKAQLKMDSDPNYLLLIAIKSQLIVRSAQKSADGGTAYAYYPVAAGDHT